MQKIESELDNLGYQILGISPDKPEKLQESIGRHEFKYGLLSDSKMELAKAFGLAFQVDEKTYKMFQGYGIDLEGASGEKHHLLPVPAVYLVGTDGVVDFNYVNPDYTVRLSADLVLDAAKVYAAEAAEKAATEKAEESESE